MTERWDRGADEMTDNKFPITFPVDVTEPREKRICMCVWALLQRCSACDPENKMLENLQLLGLSKIRIIEAPDD